MTKLFDIIGFCFGQKTIAVDTTYTDQPFILNKAKFEKWVDDRELRMDKQTGLLMAWDYYYHLIAATDLYDYILIMQDMANFDIEDPLKQIALN